MSFLFAFELTEWIDGDRGFLFEQHTIFCLCNLVKVIHNGHLYRNSNQSYKNPHIRSTYSAFRYCLFCWKLKIEHTNKIIFKCVNSIVGPSFIVFFFFGIKYLWVPWIVHGTHWTMHNHVKIDFSKKKKKNARRKMLLSVQDLLNSA